MKLLIVDDSSLIRETIIEVYQGSVFTDIQTASDGILAITAFKQQLPDIVTLDITMPNMDGLAALQKMLEIKSNTSVLVISALADHHTAIKSLEFGADQFICKPFSDDDLKEALDDIMEEQEDINTLQPSAPVGQEKLKGVISHLIPTAAKLPTTPASEDYPSGYVTPPNLQELA